MSGERYYTTKIWQRPSSIGFSSAGALSTSMDPPGEPVISTWNRPCQQIQNGSEFPELVAQNFRNPHTWRQLRAPKLSASIFHHWLRSGILKSSAMCNSLVEDPSYPFQAQNSLIPADYERLYLLHLFLASLFAPLVGYYPCVTSFAFCRRHDGEPDGSNSFPFGALVPRQNYGSTHHQTNFAFCHRCRLQRTISRGSQPIAAPRSQRISAAGFDRDHCC